MKIIRANTGEAAEIIAESIDDALDDGEVLLLLSGGSNIDLAVDVRYRLDPNSAVTIGLIDERYGSPGHPDSNWQKLIDAGFNFDEVKSIPVLDGATPEETTKKYSIALAEAIERVNAVFAIFGMGTDGHTSGVLPNSPAVKSTNDVEYYKADDFHRITTTPNFINKVDTAYLVAMGAEKRDQINSLINEEINISKQPAQYLKQADNFIIISDSYNEEADT